jgi:predicted MPP superfamily phosphohydrolase
MKQVIDFKRLPDRFRSFAARVIPVLILLHTYIGWQLLPVMPLPSYSMSIGIILLASSCFLTPLGLFARFVVVDEDLADRTSLVGYIAMGLFSSLLILTALRNLLLLFVSDTSTQSASALMVVAITLFVSLIGFVNARKIARVKHVTIRLDNLPAALHGFRIVQLSDIHVGSTIKSAYVKAIVERVNLLTPDQIAITGDIVDGSVARLGIHTAHLGQLQSRHGTYLVTGNHEYYSGAEEWITEFNRLGIKCLINEHAVINHEGARLLVAGVTDFTAHQFIPAHRSDPEQAIANSPSGLVSILLAHQPRSAAAAEKAGFHLQLSGHTHGGQFWPWNLFVPMQQPFVAGLNRLGKMWVYTSRGTGYWGPPKRFGAQSEITLITLVGKPGS